MVSEAKYLTDKSVLRTILGCIGIVAFGILIWAVAPEGRPEGFWVGLIFVLEGLIGVLINVLLSCWYPVFSGRVVTLEHYLLPSLSRVILYEEILYAKVVVFNVRQWKRSPVLTVKIKGSKKSKFILMTDPDQLGQLIDELRSRGVPKPE